MPKISLLFRVPRNCQCSCTRDPKKIGHLCNFFKSRVFLCFFGKNQAEKKNGFQNIYCPLFPKHGKGQHGRCENTVANLYIGEHIPQLTSSFSYNPLRHLPFLTTTFSAVSPPSPKAEPTLVISSPPQPSLIPIMYQYPFLSIFHNQFCRREGYPLIRYTLLFQLTISLPSFLFLPFLLILPFFFYKISCYNFFSQIHSHFLNP